MTTTETGAHMTKVLEDTLVLVTGANGDIGRATVRLLAANGAKVVCSDLQPPREPIEGTEFVALDVTSEASWKKAIGAVEQRHGKLDALVNNAGIAPMGRIEEVTLEEWKRCQQVNVEGMFLGTKTAASLLARSGTDREGGAAIVNMCSGASDKPAVFSAAYCVSKAAARMLTRASAVEFATLGYPIRVNSVHPGVVESSMMDDIIETYSRISGGADKDQLRKSIAGGNPMGRFVDPAEVAEAVLFLISPASRFVHGDAIHVDGGYAAS